MFSPTRTILLKKEIYKDLQKEKPSHLSISVLIHEEEHRKSMNGRIGFEYLFSRQNRINEEMNAYKVQFSYLKKHKASYDLDRVAKAFAGHIYLWAMGYDDAMKLLKKTWREA